MKRLLLTLALAPGGALAYSSPAQFDTAPSADSTGGSAGIHYTGSPRFQGQTCGGCHQGGEGQLEMRLSAQPPELLTNGYEPGRLYRLQVDLLQDRVRPAACGIHLGEPCNLNLFALEAVAANGAAAGSLCPVEVAADEACPAGLGSPTVLSRDRTTILANGLAFDGDGQPFFRDGETKYDFYWRAPRGDAGAVSFWVSAVDGDGARADPEHATDLHGDLTGVFRVRVCGPSGCGGEDAAGCDATSSGGTPRALGLGLCLAALGGVLRRRRALT